MSGTCNKVDNPKSHEKLNMGTFHHRANDVLMAQIFLVECLVMFFLDFIKIVQLEYFDSIPESLLTWIQRQ